MRNKLFLKNWVCTLMGVVMCISLSSCSSDEEGNTIPIPQELIGTWYNISGDSGYDTHFTFNADGTGSGVSSHNRIFSIRSYGFTYKCYAGGVIVCDAVRVWVNEDGETTGDQEIKFKLSGGKLELTELTGGNLEGSIYSK